MVQFKNVSSPFAVSGSDTDLELWMPAGLWAFVVAVLATLGLGHLKRSRTYRIACGSVELFLIDATQPDEVTIALAHNLATMREWGAVAKAQYLSAKESVAHLQGTDRKHAKADLAVRFGLNPIVYGC
jgi:hypothetical protein